MAGLHQLQSNTSAITANALNTSQSSLFQQTANMTNYALASVSQRVISFNGTSGSVTLNAGSNLSLSANGSAFTFNVTGVVQTSQSSLFQHTSATSAITSNAFPTANSSNLMNTSERNNYQYTSNSSNNTSVYQALSATTKFAGTGTTFNGANISGSLTNNSNGLQMSLSVATPAAGGGVANAASNTTYTSGTVIFSGLSNITINTSLNGASQYIQISAPTPGAAAEQNNITLGGNVAGNSTASGSTINWIAGNNVTLSGTNGSQIQINAEGVAWSLLGNTAGTNSSNLSAGSIYLSGGANVTLSGNSNTIVISAPNPGGGAGFTASSTIFGERYQWQSTSSSMGQNTIHFMPLNVETPVSASNIILPVAVTFSTSAASNGTVGHTLSYALYTRVASARSMLSTVMSSSYTMAGNYSSNSSMSYNVITSITASNDYGTKQSNSAGTNNSADIHGIREFRLPFNMSLSQGEYWLAIGNSSSAAGTAGNILRLSFIGATSNVLQSMGVAIASNNANAFKDMGLGIYRTTSGAFPNTVSFSQIAQTNQLIPRVIMINETM